MAKETIGFIGVGSLGLPIAQNLLRAGYPMKVYNRTTAKAEVLAAEGAQQVFSAAEVLSPGGIVVSVVFDGAALEEIVHSQGFLEGLGEGGVHLVMSTVAPATAKTLAALHAKQGSAYVDGPVFGRPEAADARQLWSCLAGSAGAKRRILPLIQAVAQGSFDFGETIGAATIVKLCGNFLIGAAARAMGEALSMASKQGLDPVSVINMLTQTLFGGSIYTSYGARIAANPDAFSMGSQAGQQIIQKDLGLFHDCAQEQGLPTPYADLIRGIMG